MSKWHGADLAGLRFNEDLSTRPPWLPPDSGECRLAIPRWWEEGASVPTAGVARSASASLALNAWQSFGRQAFLPYLTLSQLACLTGCSYFVCDCNDHTELESLSGNQRLRWSGPVLKLFEMQVMDAVGGQCHWQAKAQSQRRPSTGRSAQHPWNSAVSCQASLKLHCPMSMHLQQPLSRVGALPMMSCMPRHFTPSCLSFQSQKHVHSLVDV